MAAGPHFSLLITVRRNLISVVTALTWHTDTSCCHSRHRSTSPGNTAPGQQSPEWWEGCWSDLHFPCYFCMIPGRWKFSYLLSPRAGGMGAQGLEVRGWREREALALSNSLWGNARQSLSLTDSNNNHNSHLSFQRAFPASAHLGPSVSRCPSCQKGNCSQRQWCPESQARGTFLAPPSLTFPCPHPAFHGFMTCSQRGMWIFMITGVSKQSCFCK